MGLKISLGGEGKKEKCHVKKNFLQNKEGGRKEGGRRGRNRDIWGSEERKKYKRPASVGKVMATVKKLCPG